MKKLMFLVVMASMAIHMESYAQKFQYVKWKTVPTPSKTQAVTWLKKAMQGKSIPGAAVRSSAESYSAVWGENLYAEVLSASADKFAIAEANGDEVNYGVDADGNAVKTGVLQAGVPLIIYEGKPIAKWGSNGCLNALSPGDDVADSDPEDADNTPEYKPKPRPSKKITAEEISYEVKHRKIGIPIPTYVEEEFIVRIPKPKYVYEEQQEERSSNRGCSHGNYTGCQGHSNQQYQNQSGSMEITVRNKPNVLDYINTGLNVANTWFAGVNTYRGVRMENRNVSNRSYSNTWNGGGNNGYSNGDFQGGSGNYGNYSNAGTIRGTSYGTNTGGNSGGRYSNTW